MEKPTNLMEIFKWYQPCVIECCLLNDDNTCTQKLDNITPHNPLCHHMVLKAALANHKIVGTIPND